MSPKVEALLIEAMLLEPERPRCPKHPKALHVKTLPGNVWSCMTCGDFVEWKKD